jgi:hypothetical protein
MKISCVDILYCSFVFSYRPSDFSMEFSEDLSILSYLLFIFSSYH